MTLNNFKNKIRWKKRLKINMLNVIVVLRYGYDT